ncbi:MAG: response regulator containing CheY-like receiver, AAA-type ATPase, and DNA-binding domain protein [uncultured archaeon A07HN63]|nr:MAG: response regulator containing CheY-like receiver, AAA-type ATPase, and DNA-binding domain protein [uncultured archaeon A07HN63]
MSDNSPDTPTVLVVDDESDVADLYAYRLEDAFSVRTAYSGEEAIETVDETVDVILLDRRMAGDGRATRCLHPFGSHITSVVSSW